MNQQQKVIPIIPTNDGRDGAIQLHQSDRGSETYYHRYWEKSSKRSNKNNSAGLLIVAGAVIAVSALVALNLYLSPNQQSQRLQQQLNEANRELTNIKTYVCEG